MHNINSLLMSDVLYYLILASVHSITHPTESKKKLLQDYEIYKSGNFPCHAVREYFFRSVAPFLWPEEIIVMFWSRYSTQIAFDREPGNTALAFIVGGKTNNRVSRKLFFFFIISMNKVIPFSSVQKLITKYLHKITVY